jgi:hypothetical protein
MISRYFIFSAALFAAAVNAGNSTLDAAIGGGLGGAAGAAIGNELGGREGAIVGGALGAGAGAAVTTDSEPHKVSTPPQPRYDDRAPSREHPAYQHCPPGQAKKGRC